MEDSIAEGQNAGSPWGASRLAARLGIKYPIIQGPFGGIATQRLTAAVSNFGGLGSFGALNLTPDAIREAITEIRALTSKPFAVNLWVSTEDEDVFTSDEAAFERGLSTIAGHITELGGTLPSYKPYAGVRFEDQIRVLIDEKVPVISFIVGIPPREILDECRAKGIPTIGTATTPDEAVALQKAGIDIVAASGFEAGGHRGSFLRKSEDSLTGTFSLVPQVVDAVDIPVIAAGGIADARGIVAALALGADGVQMGTVFLVCKESGATRFYQETLLSDRAKRTKLTKGFTGRLARGIQNRLMDELNQPGVEILPYPLQRQLIKNLTVLAEQAQDPELTQMWAGQSAGLLRHADVSTLLQSLVSEVSSIAGPLLQWAEGRKTPSR